MTAFLPKVFFKKTNRSTGLTSSVHTNSPIFLSFDWFLTSFEHKRFNGEGWTGLGSDSRLNRSNRPVRSDFLNTV